MTLLLDTRRCCATRREAIEAATELAFSVVSLAEIGVKSAIGKTTASTSRASRCTIATPSTGS